MGGDRPNPVESVNPSSCGFLGSRRRLTDTLFSLLSQWPASEHSVPSGQPCGRRERSPKPRDRVFWKLPTPGQAVGPGAQTGGKPVRGAQAGGRGTGLRGRGLPGWVGKAGVAWGAPGRFPGRRGEGNGGVTRQKRPRPEGRSGGGARGLGRPAGPGREPRVPHSPGRVPRRSAAGADTCRPEVLGRRPRIRAPGQPPGGLRVASSRADKGVASHFAACL